VPSAYQAALALQKYIPRSWLAFAGNRLMAAKGDPRRFGVDASGNWLNIQPQGSFVGPDFHTAHYDQIEARVGSYWFRGYTPAPGDVVIDVGAGIGEDAVILSHLVGAKGRVHAIEAHPGTYGCLRSTVERSKLTNVETHALAITEEKGTVLISDDAHHLANSIVAHGAGLKVEAMSLDDFIEQTGHASIDLVKMNIEGAERGAMQGVERQAGKIRHLAISCHDFVADAGGGDQFRTRESVRARLIELGFVVTTRTNASTPWEADVLFARRRPAERDLE